MACNLLSPTRLPWESMLLLQAVKSLSRDREAGGFKGLNGKLIFMPYRGPRSRTMNTVQDEWPSTSSPGMTRPEK